MFTFLYVGGVYPVKKKLYFDVGYAILSFYHAVQVATSQEGSSSLLFTFYIKEALIYGGDN